MNWLCSLFHEWSNWIDTGSTQVLSDGAKKDSIPIAVYGRQERRCYRCNIVETRRITIA